MSQGTSSDLTHRAMKHQKSLQVDEKTLALAFTKSRSNLSQDEASLCNKINDAEQEIRGLRDELRAKEKERAKLNDQCRAYEKKLSLAKFESQSISKKSAEIHIHERQRAEQRALKHEYLCREEIEKRRALEEETQRLKNELSRVNNNASKLQQALDQERAEKDDAVTALEANKRDLEISSKGLEELQAKLSLSEKTSRELSTINKDLEAAVEETCEKLVNLATIYQRKEAEMDKYKMELRSAVNAANKNCDTAISKYEAQRKENKSLKKELESTVSELNEMKAHKADVQRLRKTAPTQYINQLRNDPRVQAKSRSGKENSFSAL
jgi:chromosome segregation ATPase